MENNTTAKIITTVDPAIAMALSMGVSLADYTDLQTMQAAIRATVGDLETAIDHADACQSVWKKAVADRDSKWDDSTADRAALADMVKKADDAVAAAKSDAADKKALLDWQCNQWDDKSLSARLDYIASQGIAEWLRLPKVYSIGVKTVKAGDNKAMIAYTRRIDLPLSALPREPIVDRMVQSIRADIRAIYTDSIAIKGTARPVDRTGLPDCYSVTDPLSNGRLAKMLHAVMAEYGMPIDGVHNGTARIYRDGAKSTNKRGQTVEHKIADLIDEIGYMAISINDSTPFAWRVVED